MEDTLNEYGLLITIWLVFGFLTAVVAGSKGQPFGVWFVVGVLLGPIGLLVAALVSRTPEAEAKRQAAIDEARRKLE